MSILLMICNKVPQGLEASRRENEQGEKNFLISRGLSFHIFSSKTWVLANFSDRKGTIVIAETASVRKQ